MTETPAAAPYRVLALKYRPTRFADLIGQEAMVRTLSNAIAQNRIAHAFMLTGVRGVGKTTTARLVARALNCVGADGKGGPTVDPCGVCENCVAIAEDRHMDVIEMDAASHNGVDDIRDLTDGARYRPVKARYKIYILDEVHMLSKPAFNALLKTLEEPPEHVKFIFATTEIRRVPITVLSRCQRFDLRRIEPQQLADLLAGVAVKEGRKVAPTAAALLARAADGSARDGLSLLDRALAHGEGDVGEAETRALLGLADRTQMFDLFEALMKGDAAAALRQLGESYRAGADPVIVATDLLDVTHWVTRLKAAPSLADDPTTPEAERARGRDFAARLSLAALTRAWQMLLKGLGEIQSAPSPLAAAEMVIVRLTHAAEMPTPAELAARNPQPPQGGAPRPGPSGPSNGGGGSTGGSRMAMTASAGTQARRVEAEPAPAGAPSALANPQSFEEVAALFEAKREAKLHGFIYNSVRLIRFEPGRIEYSAERGAIPSDFPGSVRASLERWTNRQWTIVVSNDGGEPTLRQKAQMTVQAQKHAASTDPLVDAVLKAFPGATIEAVRGIEAPAPEIGMPGRPDAPPAETIIEDDLPVDDNGEDA